MGRYLQGLLYQSVLVMVLLGLAVCQAAPLGPVIGSGLMRSEARTVRDFREVALEGTGTLTITQGATEALTIEAEDNILPVLTSEVRAGRLTLSERGTSGIRPTKPIRYTLTVQDLGTVRLSGSGASSQRGDR